ncbi:MAG: hypothetical protein M3Y70_04560 [Pseudomonadota bacterium]|nr:hypothetical protein [Pseudomonadota bacterium]
MNIADNIVLGTASTETQGLPIGIEEPLGHEPTLGIASVETQGFPIGTDEVLGMDFQSGLADR